MDNLSSMTKTTADALCRLTSGTGASVRQNYTDMDEVSFTATRPVIINGIPDLTLRPDLGDRTLSVDFRPIPDRQRRAERELQEQFKAMQPSVLGALMDLASLALRREVVPLKVEL